MKNVKKGKIKNKHSQMSAGYISKIKLEKMVVYLLYVFLFVTRGG